MKFELHCHSHYSRGSKIPNECLHTPAEAVREAKRKNLDGIAITDHMTTKGLREASREAKRQGIMFIPGQEVHTADGHLLALLINSEITNGLPVEETIDAIHDHGGFSIAPHPFDIKGDGLRKLCTGADAVEIFNAINLDRLSNRVAGGYARKTGRPVTAGSDAHSLEMIGNAVVVSDASDPERLFRDIKKGKALMETRYATPQEISRWVRSRLVSSKVDVVKYMRSNYHFPKRQLSSGMLRVYLSTPMAVWTPLAYFSLGMAGVFSAFKFAEWKASGI